MSSRKSHAVAILGELVGTFSFLFFALGGTNVANSFNPPPAPKAIFSSQHPGHVQSVADVPAAAPQDAGRLMYISLSFGLSLAVNAWIFYRISGGLFNPAVTVGLMSVGAVPWARGLVFVIAQLIGGILAAFAISGFFPDKLVVDTTLRPGMSVAGGLFFEMFLTFLLVFTILMLAVEKHRATYIAPLGIGLSLFVAELAGVAYTGGSLNPARSFGPCVVEGVFPSYHWIYWLGPVLGALLAAGFYRVLKQLGYEAANPGQDDTGLDSKAAPDERFHSGSRLEAASGP